MDNYGFGFFLFEQIPLSDSEYFFYQRCIGQVLLRHSNFLIAALFSPKVNYAFHLVRVQQPLPTQDNKIDGSF